MNIGWNPSVRFAPSVEAEISSDGSPVISRVFPTGTEAVAWAEAEREAWESQSE